MSINYHLKGGYFSAKESLKYSFLKELYDFVLRKYPHAKLKDIDFEDFFNYPPYLIGRYAGEYFLNETSSGYPENQSPKYFIGYCIENQLFIDLIEELIVFFALWRTTEGCKEDKAELFFANSWAALVDSAKYFYFKTHEELEASSEAPAIKKSEEIWDYLSNVPKIYENQYKKDKVKGKVIPFKKNASFSGWYLDEECKVAFDGKAKQNLDLYPKWTYFVTLCSNDGYKSFEELYDDLLKDFNKVNKLKLTKEIYETVEQGKIVELVYKSESYFDKFFSNKQMYQKWEWLIRYLKSNILKKEVASLLDYQDDKFKSELQFRFELNSLILGRFSKGKPKTVDYCGKGIKENLILKTNSCVKKIYYYNEMKLPLEFNNKKVKYWSKNPVNLEKIMKIGYNNSNTILYAIYEEEL